MGQTLLDALHLLATLEHGVLEIVLLSLFVSGLAVVSGTLLGLPLGALVAVSRFRDRTYVGHGGGYLGNTTQTMIQLDDKVAVIVLTNTNDSDPSGIARQLMSTVGFAVAKVAAPKPVVVAWDPSWARFAGLYRGAWGDQQVVLMNDKLVLITPNGANVDEPAQLEPLGGGRFRFMAKTGGGEVGEVVRFAEEGGRVTTMYTGDGYLRRVSP